MVTTINTIWCLREINNETNSKYIARGHFINKNTVESFKTCDKHELLKEFGEHMLDDFHSGRAIEDPSMIPAFDILMYSVSVFSYNNNIFIKILFFF